MRRMGERRPAKSSLPGMTLGLLLIFFVTGFVIWHQNKLIDATLKPTRAVKNIVEDDHPNSEERDFLKELITQIKGGE